MRLRTFGFTLVELMIVIAIIAIIAGAIYPAMSGYYARGRDTGRLSDIKALSANFQSYSRIYTTYPNNTNTLGTTTSYCVSDMRWWGDAVASIKDKQFSQLGGTGALVGDPMATNTWLWLCTQTGSYFYARLQQETSYAVLAARMERQTTWANYTTPLRLSNPAYINEMVTARPLDKSGDDVDKIFLIITN